VPGPSDSGIQQTPARSKSPVYEVAVKVVAAVILVVLTGAYTLIWAHEGRLTVLETQRTGEAKAHEVQHEAIKETLDEIKGDVKKLLEAR